MAMLIIGVLMVIFGLYLFSLGQGNIGILIIIIPAALFIVGGLILVAHGIKAVNDDGKEKDNTENESVTEMGETPTVSEEKNTIMQIREYKKLADEGIITEAEFEEKKKQLLNLSTNPKVHGE